MNWEQIPLDTVQLHPVETRDFGRTHGSSNESLLPITACNALHQGSFMVFLVCLLLLGEGDSTLRVSRKWRSVAFPRRDCHRFGERYHYHLGRRCRSHRAVKVMLTMITCCSGNETERLMLAKEKKWLLFVSARWFCVHFQVRFNGHQKGGRSVCVSRLKG